MTDAEVWAQFYAALMSTRERSEATARLADEMFKEYQKRFDKRGNPLQKELSR